MAGGLVEIAVFLDTKNLGLHRYFKNMFLKADLLDEWNTELMECKLWTQKNQIHELGRYGNSNIS